MIDLMYILTKEEIELFKQLNDISQMLGIKIYAVGGFVRDKILNIKSKDIDFVCIGSVEVFTNAFRNKYYKKVEIRIFKNFGTAQIKLPNFEIEFVEARQESYNTNSRNPNIKKGTFEEDLLRRDFTINTIAIKIDNNLELIDAFNGLNDLKLKIIKTPTCSNKTFFDDPLRILRAIRFASRLDFEIEQETFISMKNNIVRLEIVSKERINNEVNKILLGKTPSKGILLLDQVGYLEAILPELVRLKGVDSINKMSHKDNFYHSLKVLDNVALKTSNLWLIWSALLHDIGKAKTKKFQPDIGWTFHGHEIVSAYMVDNIFKRLKLPLGESKEFVKKMISLHHRPIPLSKENITDSSIRRLIVDSGDSINDLMILCRADITSKNETTVKQYLSNFNLIQDRIKLVQEKDNLRNWKCPINGEDIMKAFKLKPSKEVGQIKSLIKEAILDGRIKNNYGESYKLMIELGKQFNLTPNP